MSRPARNALILMKEYVQNEGNYASPSRRHDIGLPANGSAGARG
jgi:hypothetical protein